MFILKIKRFYDLIYDFNLPNKLEPYYNYFPIKV